MATSSLTMARNLELGRILCMGITLTCWIPGYIALKLSRLFQRDHLVGCALLSAYLGWEMQHRLMAYLFPSFC